MSKCKKCGAEVTWKEKPGGGFFPPENPDGSRHDCEKKPGAMTNATVGKLMNYNSGSATFLLKDGKQHTYAVMLSMFQDWQRKEFLMPAENHADVWLAFMMDDKHFIQPGYQQVQRPDWAAAISDPTNGEIKKPEFQRASELPKESSEPPAAAAAENPKFTSADLFTPKDRLIVAQTMLKAYSDLWTATITPDSVTFADAREEILAAIEADLPKLLKMGGGA